MSVPIKEINGLYDLFNSTNGKGWLWLNTGLYGNIWTFDSKANPCLQHWQGVNCSQPLSATANTIVSIELPYYNLVGTIPGSLGNSFSSLQILSLNGPRVVSQSRPAFLTLSARIVGYN